MKNTNKNQKSVKININEIYNKMHYQLKERAFWQQKQKDLWALISSTNENHHKEMIQIDKKIGQTTHELNKLINELCQYKKTDKAMNLAYSYILSEMERIKKIIKSKNKLISDVENGITGLIDDTGYCHVNTSGLRTYVKQKKECYNKLNQWKIHVEKYLNK